ncbi:hypothetical protein ABT112_14425 [Streptomyces sp. NPDC002055]|uniref:SCO7613 C-terminal domain-containing membrane protein n=1 Tax=Streptomyces sp. NPDC002055 TaxID=3154534 RepID=UPI00331A38BC
MDNPSPAAAPDPQGNPPAPAGPAESGRAGLENELRRLDLALARVEGERSRLLALRGQLLERLHRMGPVPAWGVPAAAAPARTRGETQPPTVQNLLLGLGGVLLAIAVTAFTVVSWGHLGIGGRSAVLGALTLAALGTPALLLRRSLTSTAESVACLALVLLALDAYALHRVALPGTDGTGYTAVVSGVLAAGWAAYGRWLGGPAPGPGAGLRLPSPVAVALAQLPLPLWAVADAGPFGLGAALLGTAAFDLVLVLRCHAPGARPVAAVSGAVTGGVGALLAGVLSVTAPTAGTAVRAAGLLLVGAALGLGAAWRRPSSGAGSRAAVCPAAASGLCAVVATGGVLRFALPGQWAVLGPVLAAALLLPAARALPRQRAVAAGLAGTAAAVHAAAVLWTLPVVAAVALGPLGRLDRVWAGAPEGALAAVGGGSPWQATLAVPAVLAAVAAVALGVRRAVAAEPRRAALSGAAVALFGAAGTVLPVALDLPYPVAVALLVAQAAVLLIASATLGRVPSAPAALVCAVVTGLVAVGWGLADESVTLGVLGSLLVALTAAAAPPGRPRQPVTATAAVVCAAGLSVALGAAAGLPAPRTAFAVLGVAAVAASVAARLRALPAGLPVECAAYGTALLAVGLAAGDAPALAAVLALAGLLAAGTALRPDRRAAAHAAAALLVCATWVRLAAYGVATPEAYTLPVTVPALALGLLRRRRDPSVSSWAAYGPGLAATLLPSLAAAWSDPHWLRPLLLGMAALGLTLAGARWRLRAPLLLGGTVLGLVALHELAPYIVQVVDALPRWLPPAVAGLLLLAVGATYEQRLRDARRVRDTLGRMR